MTRQGEGGRNIRILRVALRAIIVVLHKELTPVMVRVAVRAIPMSHLQDPPPGNAGIRPVTLVASDHSVLAAQSEAGEIVIEFLLLSLPPARRIMTRRTGLRRERRGVWRDMARCAIRKALGGKTDGAGPSRRDLARWSQIHMALVAGDIPVFSHKLEFRPCMIE